MKEHHSDPRHAPQVTGGLQPDYGNIPRLKSWSDVGSRSSPARAIFRLRRLHGAGHRARGRSAPEHHRGRGFVATLRSRPQRHHRRTRLRHLRRTRREQGTRRRQAPPADGRVIEVLEQLRSARLRSESKDGQRCHHPSTVTSTGTMPSKCLSWWFHSWAGWTRPFSSVARAKIR